MAHKMMQRTGHVHMKH